MIEKIKENFKGNKGIVSIIIGVGVLLILIFGASFAYFSVNNKNNASASNVQGDFASQGKVSLNTNVSDLYLNLNGVLMSQDKVGTKYFATTDKLGTPITNGTLGNGIYTLATASLESGTTKYNCTYKYKITASLDAPITDGSDEDIKLKFTGSSITNGSKEYTLKELITAGANGVEFTGIFENLTAGNNQTITIESTVENTSDKQDDFAGNSYSINISPLPDSEGFSCEINYLPPTVTASLNGDTIIANITKGDNDLDSYCVNQESTSESCTWNKLSGTTINYNPTSTGTYYVHVKDVKDKIGNSEGIYYEKPKPLSEELIATGELWQSGLEGDGYRYTGSGAATAGTSPNNFVCFGTSDKGACTGNPNNYMYRIIGVFLDGTGNQYVKLIKYVTLGKLAWNANLWDDVTWEESDLYKNLNGSTFLTNTTYVPNATWSNKIANWKWSTVNTLTYEIDGPDYYNSLSPNNIYLHEMNRSNKASTIGEWTTPTAKIGLMYASDYALSLGQTAKNMNGSTLSNASTLKTGWMFVDNNSNTSGTSYEWTISRCGSDDIYYNAWFVLSDGGVSDDYVTITYAVRPTFYLASTVELQSGSGTISDPYIID